MLTINNEVFCGSMSSFNESIHFGLLAKAKTHTINICDAEKFVNSLNILNRIRIILDYELWWNLRENLSSDLSHFDKIMLIWCRWIFCSPRSSRVLVLLDDDSKFIIICWKMFRILFYLLLHEFKQKICEFSEFF